MPRPAKGSQEAKDRMAKARAAKAAKAKGMKVVKTGPPSGATEASSGGESLVEAMKNIKIVPKEPVLPVPTIKGLEDAKQIEELARKEGLGIPAKVFKSIGEQLPTEVNPPAVNPIAREEDRKVEKAIIEEDVLEIKTEVEKQKIMEDLAKKKDVPVLVKEAPKDISGVSETVSDGEFSITPEFSVISMMSDPNQELGRIHRKNIESKTNMFGDSGATPLPPPEVPPPEPSVMGDSQAPPPPTQPQDVVPFATDEPKQEHKVKYYPNQILLYFGSTTKPDWDQELEANVFSMKMSSDEIGFAIDNIISAYKEQLFIKQRQSTTLEELHELMQLQFCILRNLQRGTRAKMAMVPVSSLVNFASKLAPQQQQQPVQPGEAPFMEAGDMVGSQPPTEQAPVQPEPPQSVQVQVPTTQREAIENIIKTYRGKNTDPFGKPIIIPSLRNDTKHHIQYKLAKRAKF